MVSFVSILISHKGFLGETSEIKLMLKRNITGFRSPEIWGTNLKAIKCSSGCVMKWKMSTFFHYAPVLCKHDGPVAIINICLFSPRRSTDHSPWRKRASRPGTGRCPASPRRAKSPMTWMISPKLDGKEQFFQPGRSVASHDRVPSLLALRPHVDHAHSHAPLLRLVLRPSPPFQYGDGDGLERPSTSDRSISQRWTSQSTVNLEACHPPQPSDLEPALSHAPLELQAPPKTLSPVCPA